MTAPLFGIVGWKNSGKTTLLAKLVTLFAARGLKVAAVKHAHHGFDVDQEGRDSYRYRAAGAQTVAVSSAKRFAIMTELKDRPEPKLDELLQYIDGVDLILVEGFKSERHPKLEVRRREASNHASLAAQDPTIIALAADFAVREERLPTFALDDVEAIGDFILNRVAAGGMGGDKIRGSNAAQAEDAISTAANAAAKEAARDDCFAFSSRRLRHEEAVALLKTLASPLVEKEKVRIYSAVGRVIARTIAAPRPVPAHTNAAVDGFAFAFDSYDARKGTLFPISGRAAAGDEVQRISAKGGAVRIFTGAIMPEGCDTVAMQEDCRLDGEGSVFIPAGLKKGSNRRLAGEDMPEGAAVVEAGTRLRPQDAAALAASGCAEIACFRIPRICIFSTGNEVLAPGAALGSGKVYDANGPMLAGLFAPLGVSATYGGILPDDRSAVHNALHAAAENHDAIVTTGGASLGEEDHVVAALRAADALSLWQLAIKPGRPMGVGKIGSCLAFALPGNPVAVLVCALLYVWPVVRRLGGESWIDPLRLTFPAGFEIKARKQGRREFFRGWLEDRSGVSVAIKYPRDGSGLISSLRAASGLIEIPEEAATIVQGDPVAFLPFSQFGIL